jgi:hypothetical protein
MRKSLLSILVFIFVGCSTHDDSVSLLSDIPVTTLKEMIRFDTIGDNYLSHIGYTSIALNDGNILVPDRQLGTLFKVNSSGELIETIGRRGNGPGKFQDISFLNKSAFGNSLIYDQMNQKVIVLNNQGHYFTEFLIPPNRPSGSLIEVYEVEAQQYLMVFQSFDYMINENAEQVSNLVIYNREQEIVSPAKTIKSSPYARRTGGGGGMRAPYVASDLLAYDNTTADVYLYRSDGHNIAQLDVSLDTIQISTFDLEPEKLTKTESDSI